MNVVGELENERKDVNKSGHAGQVSEFDTSTGGVASDRLNPLLTVMNCFLIAGKMTSSVKPDSVCSSMYRTQQERPGI